MKNTIHSFQKISLASIHLTFFKLISLKNNISKFYMWVNICCLFFTFQNAWEGSLGRIAEENVTIPTMVIATGCIVPVCESQGDTGSFVIWVTYKH